MQKSRVVVSCFAVGMLMASAYAQDRAPRTDKVQGVGFHLVSAAPATGYNQATFEGQTYYVAAKATIVADQIDTVQSNASSITLTGSFASSKSNQMGVLIDGQLAGVGTLAMQNGQATITGLTAAQSQRVTHLLSRKSVSPTTAAAFTVVPTGQSNGEYTFDVFIKNVPELRTYQVKLEVTGGTAGSLAMTDVRIDENRPDYVFTGNEAVKAADHGGSRLGGTLFNGTVAVVDAPKYVGSWRFRPSSDAAGTFNINIVAGTESFIANQQNQNQPISLVGATVQIGGKSRLSE